MPWGLEVQVGDPFSNRIVFHQLVEDDASAVEHVDGSAAPIVHELRVDGAPDHAFRVLTERIGAWWDPVHAPPGLRDVVIEPGVGGACTMLLHDGTIDRWGTVTAWEPGSRYAQTFLLGGDANHPTEVDVSFVADGGATRVRFAHGGWTAANVAGRPSVRRLARGPRALRQGLPARLTRLTRRLVRAQLLARMSVSGRNRVPRRNLTAVVLARS